MGASKGHSDNPVLDSPTQTMSCNMQRVRLASALLVLVISSALLAPSLAAASSADTLQQLRHAAKHQPNNPLPHVQLALALHELNHQRPDGGSRVPEAEQEYRKALSLISPHGEHAHIYMHVQGNLGALLLSADRPTEAITEFQAALQLGQQLEKQLQEQIKQQTTKKKRKGQAKQQQQQGLSELQHELQEVQQQLGGTLFNFGKALTSVGRLSEADEVHAQAAATAHGHDFGSYGKSLAAMRRISPDAAAQAVKVCETATKHFAAAQPSLAFLKDVQPPAADMEPSGADDQESSTDDQLETPAGDWITKAASVDLVWLYFALYKHYHHGKHTDLAWHYLQLGNRIMGAHVSHDFLKEQRNLQQIKGLFRAPFVTSGLQDRTAIFIVGMPRSGSTLVEQMLASHSQVFAAGEDTAMAPLTPAINQALATSPPEDHSSLLQDFGKQYLATMRAKVPQHWFDQKQASTAASGTAAGGSSSPHIADKMLRNLWLVGYIHMLLPNACILHVARHPMDVAMSCYAQPFGYSTSALAWAWDLSTIASQLQMAWELAEHWEQQLPGRVQTVFYEELVERPEAVARRLLSACGLPWEPGVLQFHDTDRSVQTASMEQVRQPLYKTSVQRWKEYRQQLEPLREALAPLIGRYEQMLSQRLSAPDTQTDMEHHDDPAGPGSDVVKDEL